MAATIAREALDAIAWMTGSQPAALNMPAEDWYKGRFYDAVGTAARAIREMDEAPAEVHVAELRERISALTNEVRAKGYPDAAVQVSINGPRENPAGAYFGYVLTLSDAGRPFDRCVNGPTVDYVLAELRAAVDLVGIAWTAEDVAATIGIVTAPALDPRDPDPSREGVFRDHNCARCKSGAQPERCPNPGNPRNCDTLYARND